MTCKSLSRNRKDLVISTLLILSRSNLIDGVLGFQVQRKQLYALRTESMTFDMKLSSKYSLKIL